MKRDLFKLSVSELRDWFNRETKQFIAALESGASWEQLQEKKNMMRNISIMIEEKTANETMNPRNRRGGSPDSR